MVNNNFVLVLKSHNCDWYLAFGMVFLESGSGSQGGSKYINC